MTPFVQKLLAASERHRSLLCVGLDPEQDRMPAEYRKMDGAEAARAFSIAAIDATRDLAQAFKPNAAYFEQHGPDGVAALRDVIRHAREHAPVVLDAKRGDIGSTSRAYAKAAFDALGADAVTVSPYMGEDSLDPFLERRDKGVFVLCRTSNAGGRDFQELADAQGVPLFERVVQKAREWNVRTGNVGLVAGATFPEQLARIRRAAGEDVPLLIPGVGAQGASLADAARFGCNMRGERALVSASRAILYAGNGSTAAMRQAAQEMRDELNKHRGLR